MTDYDIDNDEIFQTPSEKSSIFNLFNGKQ